MTSRGKQDVELVEADEPADDGVLGHPEVGVSRERVPLRRRIVRAWPIAVVGLLVAGVYLVSGWRDRVAVAERHAALQGQEAFVADLGPGLALEAIFTSDAEWAFPEVHDDVVIVHASAGDRTAFVVLDEATGAELWRTERDSSETHFHCIPVPVDPVSMIECRYDTYVVDAERLGDLETSERERRELRTGEVLDSWTAASDSRESPWRGGRLRVVSSALGSTVQLEGADGHAAWSVPLLDDPVEEDEGVVLWVEDDWAAISVRDRAFVIDPSGAVILEEHTAGLPLDPAVQGWEVSRFPELLVRSVPGGGFALWHSGNDAERRTFVYRSDGDLAYEFPGELGFAWLDDGSLGDVLPWHAGGEVLLAERETGEVTFRAKQQVDRSLAILDGALVVGDAGRVRSVDVRSGEERWSIVGDVQASDGDVALVQVTDVSAPALLGVDLDSGTERWRVSLPSPDALTLASQGNVFVHDDGTLYRLVRDDR